jgi:hypothetical protein
MSLLEDKTGHDANFRFARSDDTGAVGANQGAIFVAQVSFDHHHVFGGDSFCDANNHVDSSISGFHYGVSGKCGGNKNDADVGASAFHRFLNGVKNGAIQVQATAFAWGYTSDNVGAVFDHLGGVKGSFVTGETLNHNLGIFIDENAHEIEVPQKYGTRAKMPCGI